MLTCNPVIYVPSIIITSNIVKVRLEPIIYASIILSIIGCAKALSIMPESLTF